MKYRIEGEERSAEEPFGVTRGRICWKESPVSTRRGHGLSLFWERWDAWTICPQNHKRAIPAYLPEKMEPGDECPRECHRKNTALWVFTHKVRVKRDGKSVP